jgi:molecular chaperone Hsp33
MDRVRTLLGEDGRLRVRVASTTELVAEAVRRHAPSEPASCALARALTSVALIPMSWKDADRVAVQWSGRGPLGSVVAEAREDGTIRGYVSRPAATLPVWSREPRPFAVGIGPRGYVSVVQQARGGTFTQGQSELAAGGVDDDLARWFADSAQVPTCLRVDEGSGEPREVIGVLAQALPGDGETRADPSVLPNLDVIEDLTRLSDDELVQAVFRSGDARVIEEKAVSFGCPCSRERAAMGVAMLEEDELLGMVAEDHGAEIKCEFCTENYAFSAEDLCSIIDEKRARDA